MLLFDFMNPYIVYMLYNLVTIFSIYALFKYKAFFVRHEKTLLIILTILMVYSQVTRYVFIGLSGAFSWQETLPLYVCRISSLTMTVYLLTRSERLHNFLYFWGATSIIGVIVPSGHILLIAELNETYFIDHYILGVFPFFLLSIKGFQPDVKKAGIYAFLFAVLLIFTIPLNQFLNADYFYLESQNIAVTLVPGMSTLTFAMLHALAMFGFFLLYHQIAYRTHAFEHNNVVNE